MGRDAAYVGAHQEQLRGPRAHRQRLPGRRGQDLPVLRRPVRPLLRATTSVRSTRATPTIAGNWVAEGLHARPSAGVRDRGRRILPRPGRPRATSSPAGGTPRPATRRRDRSVSGGAGSATPSLTPAASTPPTPTARRSISCWVTRSSATSTASRTPASRSTRATRRVGAALSRMCPGVRERASRRPSPLPASGLAAVQGRPHRHPGDRVVRRVDRRWASSAGPADGPVDAAFVGLDGKTYLFSGRPVRPLRRRGLLACRARLPAARRPELGRDDERAGGVRPGRPDPPVRHSRDAVPHPARPRVRVVRATSTWWTPGSSAGGCGNDCSRTGCRSPPRAG